MDSPAAPELVAADFFVLRTPLLPFDELVRWSAGLAARAAHDADAGADGLAAAVAADRQLLRCRLGELLARPEIEEALRVASPSLFHGLNAWREDPDGKKGVRFEQALVRYVERMAARPTPFGLFSGCTTGTTGDGETTLRMGDRSSYRRHTRLDSDLLAQLCAGLGQDPEMARRQQLRPNSSLYRVGDRLRYAECRLEDGSRRHHLVSVTGDPYLERVLERAATGATTGELAADLVVFDPEVEPDEALGYVDDLVAAQVLEPEVALALTGDSPADELVARLRELDACSDTADRLEAIQGRLARLDDRPPGSGLGAYDEIHALLGELPCPVTPGRALQVDMTKPGNPRLGPAVIERIERGVRLLHRLAEARRRPELDAFRQAFLERHEEGEEVPLAAVLDDELGCGFGDLSGSDVTPLLQGMPLPGAAAPRSATGPARAPLAELLARKVDQALRRGALEIELEDKDLDGLASPADPLPDAFVARAVLAEGEGDGPEIFLDYFTSPSGAQLLGRFCHADRKLAAGVRRHLGREESLDPEAIFAEVVHLPEGRLGNVIHRPVLRRHEIPFLGRGGGAEEHRIPLDDLLVSVTGGEVVLRSRRLGRRVVPRLASAHNFGHKSLGVYRFLCTLQTQGTSGGLTWSWGALSDLPFLPRVRSGGVVFHRARWRVRADEIDGLSADTAAERFAAAQRWRTERRLPRRVLLADGDNELLVDLDNSLSVDAFAATVARRPGFELVEPWPGPEALAAHGPEGAFVHELLVPFTRRTSPRRSTAPTRTASPGVRTFHPGSEWLYAKLYTGTATADRVLGEVVRPLAAEATTSGVVDRWFFLRYDDPRPHLRLRFHGDPDALGRELLPRLQRRLAPLLADGRVWRLQIEEYRREVERYGGGAGIEIAEHLFHADSEAVLEMLAALPEDGAEDARWRLALVGIDRLLADLTEGAAGHRAVLAEMKGHWADEYRVEASPELRRRLADRLRAERSDLRALLFEPVPAGHPLAPALAALARRSRRMKPWIAELRARERAGALTAPVRKIAYSLVHMFANRLLRSRGREHEMVLSDFLERLHHSEAARRRAAPVAPAECQAV